MKRLILKDDYCPKLGVLETEVAIKFVKDTFENELAKRLNLTRVSAPLFVLPKTGLNDNLNGYERAVRFDIHDLGVDVEIVQSLAKWKRNALKKYKFADETGLYTDMNAIRRDEELDNFHSVYVDQWDWEKIIRKDERTISYLQDVVKDVYLALRETGMKVEKKFAIDTKLPEDIYFISSEDLLKKYPDLSPKERENAICQEKHAVFIMQIGGNLSNGEPHDGRAADYDDWSLNGDIIVWHELLGVALELSSMGIRVNRDSLLEQAKQKNELDKIYTPYAQNIINDVLPQTIGGGIGQSRLCMFFLQKAHIGEVQASLWSDEDLVILEEHNIHLL